VKYVSGGIYGLTRPAVDVLDRCMAEGVSRMRNYQRRLVEAGLDLKAYVIDQIIDVDHAGDIATAQEFIK
ncbi:MAG: NDP-sugar synthase, partial [Duncaniella sp.]|nr:NDP-sugar synthase [Duncaniella sp.]